MNYYSAESEHGSDTSMGFCNDTIVKAFSSKTARDNYVANSSNISVAAIQRHEATAHAANQSMTTNSDGKPVPFSTQYWAIVYMSQYMDPTVDPEGFIGTLDVVGENRTPESFVVDRFYK